MSLKRILWVGVVILLLTGCGGPKVFTALKDNAAGFEASGDFIRATNAWEQYFNQVAVEETAGADFANAAKSAFKAGELSKAKSWFDQARYKDYADAEMYQTLGEIYNSEDNLSKELSALETYLEKFGTSNTSVNTRLFSIYSEIDSDKLALGMWSKMDATSKNSEALLNTYLKVNEVLENHATCDSTALVLLKINPENINGLEWLAKKHYWAGQNRYKSEMDKYNKKKTRKNYSILLKELDIVTADFRKALPYLDKLWKLQPGKEYAGYLANIYALFGDEKKTKYYKSYRK